MFPGKNVPLPGLYAPTLILHGGAGNITRRNLPPTLYDQYESSLLSYLDSTRQLLGSGSSALDSAVHAVSLMEDDPLFNCGRGSVFTERGTIEMEASVMVASVDPDRGGRDDKSVAAGQKRGASVSLVQETRHPIQLAREVLLVSPNGQASSMHCQLSGPDVENWGWRERMLERKDRAWFWTRRRWAEHLKGLQKDQMRDHGRPECALAQEEGELGAEDDKDNFLPSQGTVGAVCMDSWGDVAVATSTGGLTNKNVGRIGDTPTLGAGFWAESWEETLASPIPGPDIGGSNFDPETKTAPGRSRLARAVHSGLGDLFQGCLPQFMDTDEQHKPFSLTNMGNLDLPPGNVIKKQPRPRTVPGMAFEKSPIILKPCTGRRRHAVALSGTGNGDTFLRTAACRTTAAICRYSIQNPISNPISLRTALNMTAGPDGEMQRSAGERWKVTGEGQAGMIAIEVWSDACDAGEVTTACSTLKQHRRTGRAVFDFNCGGLWRAWVDEGTGKGRVMVFREDYH